MPLGLDTKFKSHLVEILERELPEMKVMYEAYFTYDARQRLTAAEKAMPNGKVRNTLVSYIDDQPVRDFVIAQLQSELRDTRALNIEAKTSRLSTLQDFDIPKISASMVQALDSLPWQYTLTFQLPESIAVHLATAKDTLISDAVRIVRLTGDAAKKFPRTHANKLRQSRIGPRGLLLGYVGGKADAWDPNGTYMQIGATGFINLFGSTNTAEISKALVRSFFGLGLATQLFERNYGIAKSPSKIKFYVHREFGEKWELETTFEMDEDASNLINDLSIRVGSGLIPKPEFVATQIASIANVFSSGEPGEKVVRAARWLFDSYAGRDELLRFVQTMIVLEILLGSGDEPSEQIGLGELLRNRCAYLIARTHKERAEILSAFGKIYRIRSQIVHRGKSRLSANDRPLFMQLLQLCMRVINAEVDLLRREETR